MSASTDLDHHVWLTRRLLEDGIWLQCRCGWECNLGWLATPADAWFEEQRHRDEIAAQGRKAQVVVHHPQPTGDDLGTEVLSTETAPLTLTEEP